MIPARTDEEMRAIRTVIIAWCRFKFSFVNAVNCRFVDFKAVGDNFGEEIARGAAAGGIRGQVTGFELASQKNASPFRRAP